MASIHTLGNGPFLFTREGFRELKDRIKSFGKTHQRYLAQFGETRPVQFKDEMDSERAELERGEACINSQVAVLQHYLQFGEIAPKPVDDGLLTIGKIVTLARLDRNEEPKEWLVVGHEETDLHATPPRIAYSCPLLDGLYEQEVGAANDRAEITAIRLPTAQRKAA